MSLSSAKLHSEFQASLGYGERLCLKTTRNTGAEEVTSDFKFYLERQQKPLVV